MKKADGLETLFCDVDDFCQKILPHWRCKLISQRQRQRSFTMSPSEVMTIIIHFHRSHYRNFKNYYLSCICGQALRQEFPRRVSYNRFVELMQSVLIPLSIYLHLRRVSSRGIAFIDSTPIAVCHNRRITRHRTFVEVAQRGKNSIGWFYGFKLHLVVDDQGELISFFVTPGNVDDRKGLEKMSKFIKGQLFGDKGYISKALVEALWDKGVQLITTVRRNMKPVMLDNFDKFLLRKRSIIETINDPLKNISQLEHSRHRSLTGFMLNLVASLIAYSYQPKKLALNLNSKALVLVDSDNCFHAFE